MKSCPFCGNTSITFDIDQSQGMKYGSCVCNDCFARGPEVRTNYDSSTDAPWHEFAEIEWDNRPA